MADSFGAKLWIKKTAEVNWYEAADVIEGDAAKLKKMFTERKSLGQANRYVKKKGNFYDPGSLGLKLAFTKTKFAKLKEWFDDPDPWMVRIEVPDTEDTSAPIDVSRFASDGLLVDLGQPLPADGGRLETDITVELSGQVTFTEATTATT